MLPQMEDWCVTGTEKRILNNVLSSVTLDTISRAESITMRCVDRPLDSCGATKKEKSLLNPVSVSFV